MTDPNDSDDGAVEEALVDRLTALGFTEYEAHTLVALTRLGTGTAKEIAAFDEVPRTRVYDAAESLHELGLVDIQYGTPRRFSVASREAIVETLDGERERRIGEVSEMLGRLDTVERSDDRGSVWTVAGGESIETRIAEFLDAARERVLYMTTEGIPPQDHVDRLESAAARGVAVTVAGVEGRDLRRLREAVPSADTVETCWEWSDTPLGRLLVADGTTALVSVRADATDGEAERAIWGRGERNTLVVVLRAMFTPRLAAPAGD